MKCMVLAAGLGTRLLPLTLCRAKSAVPYRNQPLICHCLKKLAAEGIDQVAVNLHHLPDSVRQAVSAANLDRMRIRYSYEPKILGTAGALNPVRDWLAKETFLLVNGKIVFDFDLRAALTCHRQSGALSTLVLVDDVKEEDFNPVFVNPQGAVTGFARTGEERVLPGMVFTGIHIVDSRIWQYIPVSGATDMVRDVYAAALKRGELVASYHATGSWLEFSTLPRYWRLNAEAGGNCIGYDARIHPSAELTNCVVWNGVYIAQGCELENCVVADGVDLPEHTRLKNVVIVPAWLASPEFQPYVRGENIIYPWEIAR
ncbi:MAG: NDP-sugar synthase [Acidobacteria bacterium]|nr:NDP-sugar synthase [Acidobacteriota bacterium]